mgnify:CR=1 FL=1
MAKPDQDANQNPEGGNAKKGGGVDSNMKVIVINLVTTILICVLFLSVKLHSAHPFLPEDYQYVPGLPVFFLQDLQFFLLILLPLRSIHRFRPWQPRA